MGRQPNHNREEAQVLTFIFALQNLSTLAAVLVQSLAAPNTTVCGYFKKHAHRMRYNEYLAAGYPIASGVIEGACRHLVKDRMERSGMRWRLVGAQAMLHVRAVYQSSYWDDFHKDRIAREQCKLHPHRALLSDYHPINLAG